MSNTDDKILEQLKSKAKAGGCRRPPYDTVCRRGLIRFEPGEAQQIHRKPCGTHRKKPETPTNKAAEEAGQYFNSASSKNAILTKKPGRARQRDRPEDVGISETAIG